GAGMRLGDFLLAGAVEGVVHGLDLGVEPVRDALRLAVKACTGLLGARAPGRSVEVRVPPFAAVQVVEGPRHTRGTPPNVVEAEAVAFVEVAVGRLSWAAATADGRVRASGVRADLRPYLPLLRIT
ncbi:sterol carrier family protein, partial [Candidatus Protofrankia californiensis]|uniref:sterol carrier family protein n=1 Tax=Candidatus Protofrankia californiensis TaxID=1839754 RepID=UPI001F497EC7